MFDEADCLVVGRFGRPHGIKGFVTVYSFTEPQDNLLRYTDWHAFLNKAWIPLKLSSIETHDKAIRVLVEGYSSRELAGQLTNCDIAIARTQLAALKSGEYYWHQLIGMQVINTNNELFGNVIEILPTGSNDVLVVKGKKRHLIPFLMQQVIVNIKMEEKLIIADWDMDF